MVDTSMAPARAQTERLFLERHRTLESMAHCPSSDLPYLVVADIDRREFNRIEDIFRYDFQTVWMRDAMSITNLVLPEGRVGVVLVSDNLPRAGADFVEALRLNPATAASPVVLMVQSALRPGGERFSEFAPEAMLTRPLLPTVLRATVQRLMRRSVQKSWQSLRPRHRELLATTLKLFSAFGSGAAGVVELEVLRHGSRLLVDACSDGHVSALLDALRQHDDYTWVHSTRVAAQMVMFGRYVGMSRGDLELLAEAGLVHDIGKLKVPLAVLNKQGPLTPGERASMETHVGSGMRLLEALPGISREASQVTARHHERLDGTGYPFGLKGSEIDEASLLAAPCDVYVALTDRRCYKPAFSKDQALSHMRERAGSHFDGKLLDRFAEVAL